MQCAAVDSGPQNADSQESGPSELSLADPLKRNKSCNARRGKKAEKAAKKNEKGRGGGKRRRRAGGNKDQTKQATRKKKPRKGTAGGGGTQRQGPGHPGPETKESKRQGGAERGRKKKRKANKRPSKGQPQPGGGQAKQKDKAATGKVRRNKTRPGGRPARPGQEEHAHAHTPGTRVWRPPTRKGRCRRPHETAPVHRPSPPSNNGRYGKPDASVTGSTHANHRCARSPRPTPEGPARDNTIAGPRTGTTRSDPSAPASAGASGRHNEPGSRPASACPAQPPSKSGDESPRGGERHHGVGKADLRTESDRTGRGAAHHAGPRGTLERHAAGHNQGTRTSKSPFKTVAHSAWPCEKGVQQASILPPNPPAPQPHTAPTHGGHPPQPAASAPPPDRPPHT